MKHQLREDFTKCWATEIDEIASRQLSVTFQQINQSPKIKAIINENERAFNAGYFTTIKGKNLNFASCEDIIQLKVYPLFRDSENMLTFTSKESLYDKSAFKIDNYFSINENDDSDSNYEAVINHINRSPIIKIKQNNIKKQINHNNDISSFASNFKNRQEQSRKIKQLTLANYELNFLLSYRHLESLILPKTTFCK